MFSHFVFWTRKRFSQLLKQNHFCVICFLSNFHSFQKFLGKSFYIHRIVQWLSWMNYSKDFVLFAATKRRCERILKFVEEEILHFLQPQWDFLAIFLDWLWNYKREFYIEFSSKILIQFNSKSWTGTFNL
jgi:hypothetical protein